MHLIQETDSNTTASFTWKVVEQIKQMQFSVFISLL